MKSCKNANNCCYGHCFKENICAYNENLTNKDFCPLYIENWEITIDEVSSKESANNEK